LSNLKSQISNLRSQSSDSRPPPSALLSDALAIWHAGLAAVRSDRLVRDAIHVAGDTLIAGDEEIPLATTRRIAVVGAGKAGTGMAAALEEVFGRKLAEEKHLTGWVNVPADCVRPLENIRLHAARPAGVNEPTAAGAAGAAEILRIVESLGPDDLCICLLSGGGSALLPAPVEAITLADKLAVTRHFSAAGANIEQLNTVRKQLSRVKGGGLARACRAGRLVSLIISDVPGDPLDLIASGPTVEGHSSPKDALDILEQYSAREAGVSAAVFQWLARPHPPIPSPPVCRVTNLVIGNNATAVDAAGMEAERRGYSHAMISARQPEGEAEEVGRHLAEMGRRMREQEGPDCLISGGEPVVRLVERSRRGQGGRNQQLALAALDSFWQDGAEGLAFLSAGTDGEDGPTDAAGAFFDARIVRAAHAQGLSPREFLARNDAYHFFAPLDALLKTGPTHTNVCDLRVVVTRRGD
jgi:glycerate 2-kinase